VWRVARDIARCAAASSIVAQTASLLDRANAIDVKAGWQPALRKPASHGIVARTARIQQAGTLRHGSSR